MEGLGKGRKDYTVCLKKERKTSTEKASDVC